MLIPISSRKADNLCLSVIELEKGYSVAIMELCNGWEFLEPIPSYMYNDPEIPWEFDACPCMSNYPVFKGDDVLELIRKALDLLQV